jgi:hypothetical protein
VPKLAALRGFQAALRELAAHLGNGIRDRITARPSPAYVCGPAMAPLRPGRQWLATLATSGLPRSASPPRLRELFRGFPGPCRSTTSSTHHPTSRPIPLPVHFRLEPAKLDNSPNHPTILQTSARVARRWNALCQVNTACGHSTPAAPLSCGGIPRLALACGSLLPPGAHTSSRTCAPSPR